MRHLTLIEAGHVAGKVPGVASLIIPTSSYATSSNNFVNTVTIPIVKMYIDSLLFCVDGLFDYRVLNWIGHRHAVQHVLQ